MPYVQDWRKETFFYEGPILRYDRVMDPRFKATTSAVSPAQALNNFKAQAKQKLGLSMAASVQLPGQISKYVPGQGPVPIKIKEKERR